MSEFNLKEFLENAKPRSDLVHTGIVRVSEAYLIDGYLEVVLDEDSKLLFKHGFNLERDDILRYQIFKGVKIEEKGSGGDQVKVIHESGIECILKPYDRLGNEVEGYVLEIKKSETVIEELQKKVLPGEVEKGLIGLCSIDFLIKRFDITYFTERELGVVEWPFKAEKLRDGLGLKEPEVVTFTYLDPIIIKENNLESLVDHELIDLPQCYKATPPISYHNFPKRPIGD